MPFKIFMIGALALFSILEVQAQPDVDLSHTEYNFGFVGVGLSAEWELKCTNGGDDNLTIHSVTTALPEFTVKYPSFPQILAPEGNLTIALVFQPSLLDVYNDTVVIHSTDPDEEFMKLPVKGQGVSVVTVTVPDSSVPAGSQVKLPIFVDDLSGLDITSAEMRFVFDRRILTAPGASNVGTLTEFWDLEVETIEGQIHIRMSGLAPPTPSPPFSGDGIFLYIDFHVFHDAPPGESTPIVMADIMFNEGVPVAVPNHGSITVAAYTLSGMVRYYKHDTPVHGVRLSLQGGIVDSVSSDAEGFYQFNDVPGGRDYTIVPSRSGDVRAAITSYDAALVLRHMFDFISLDEWQRVVADVTGLDGVTSFDVSHILQFRVGKIDQFPVGAEWLFVPEEASYSFLSSNYLNEDYTALVYGDVSGNWGRSAMSTLSVPRNRPRIVFPDDLRAKAGESVSIPLRIEEADGIISADVQMRYNSEVLDLIDVRTTPFTSDYVLQFDTRGNVVIIALAGAQELRGTGVLVHLIFRVSAITTADEHILFEISATVNEDMVIADHVSGMVTLSHPISPERYSLAQNYPNPFNSATNIRYTIPSASAHENVTLKIFNVLGYDIRT